MDDDTGGKRRLTTRDFDPDVLRLFDDYVHGVIDRRGFLSGAGRVAGAAGAAALLAALSPRFAAAQQVAPDDPRLDARHMPFASPKGSGKASGYLVRPKAASGKLPMVLVAHENRGLNPHIEDVARRFALAGYIAFAPDALFPLGGYPGDEDKARAAFGQLDQDKVKADFLAAAAFLRGVPRNNGHLGATGFCWGGGIANVLATQLPDLRAAVPFYGVAPPLEDVPRIRAELLVVLAGEDARVNATWPAYQAALEAAGVKYTLFQPPGTQHGFHNDTTPRYDEAAAKAAWTKMLALFERTLKPAA
jgi:carboxymethylenebutenolidase